MKSILECNACWDKMNEIKTTPTTAPFHQSIECMLHQTLYPTAHHILFTVEFNIAHKNHFHAFALALDTTGGCASACSTSDTRNYRHSMCFFFVMVLYICFLWTSNWSIYANNKYEEKKRREKSLECIDTEKNSYKLAISFSIKSYQFSAKYIFKWASVNDRANGVKVK